MKLKEGQFAPDFTVTDIYGREIQLSEFKGTKIILGFYRNVSCPFCNRRVHQIMGNNVRLKQKNVQMIFFFESSNQKLSASVFHKGISPWPLIGDPEKQIYKLYGVEESVAKTLKTSFYSSLSIAKKYARELNLPEDKKASKTLIPADFFIDENQKIVKVHYGNHLDDHVPLDELKAYAGIDMPFSK
jgi:peroxiredoxin Q/BCP